MALVAVETQCGPCFSLAVAYTRASVSSTFSLTALVTLSLVGQETASVLPIGLCPKVVSHARRPTLVVAGRGPPLRSPTPSALE